MRKGVSTVIATILMLVITIALAGLAFSYISGFFGGQTSKVVDLASVDCAGTTITAVIRNTGTQALNIPNNAGSELAWFVGAVQDTNPGCQVTPLQPGNSTVCNGLVGATGSNTLKIVAPGNTVSGTVLCT